MKVRNFLVYVLMFFVCTIQAQNKNDQEMDQFINNLMSQMTLEEKLGQLNLPSVGFDVTGPIVSQGVEEKIKKGLVGGVFNTFTPNAVKKLQELAVNSSRLKIPLLFGYDVIHGHKTIFPINLGLAASWDMDLIEKVAKASATEAAADGLNWVYSPMVDIARDPRWGRVSEGSGEDPYLGAEITKAMVKGLQQNDLASPNTVLATVKHFALYGAGEAGRDYNTVDMSRIRMYNEYFLPYKAAVDAGVGSVMTSFNEVEGVPASGNKWLLTDVLRKEWGFDGLIVSDYTSVNEMIAHGMGDGKDVAALALNAGLDMDMVGELFIIHGVELVKSGRVPLEKVEAACRKVLEAKYKLGLFKNPYLYVNEAAAKKEILSPDKLALSKEAAIKSMVLLKNDKNLLPLNPNQKIAFIGPLVKDQRNLIGSWSAAGKAEDAVSIEAALKAGKYKFTYAKGANLVDDPALLKRLNDHDGRIQIDPKSPDQLIEEAVNVAKNADVVVAVLGEAFGMTGEAASRADIGLLKNQAKLLRALKATGKPIVLVLMNGRPMTLSWEDENIESILETWYSGTKAGDAIVDVLFGKANPSGKLAMTFPRSVGQIPIYYNHKNTGRPMDEHQKYTSKYLDVANTPLYAFGHGLSYSKFEYSTPVLSATVLNPTQTITLSLKVKNTSKVDGEEVVQLYIQDMVGSITRPVQELKKFKKVTIAAGATVDVSFDITTEDLKFYNQDLQFDYEPGKFRVMVGTSSDKVQSLTFEAVK